MDREGPARGEVEAMTEKTEKTEKTETTTNPPDGASIAIMVGVCMICGSIVLGWCVRLFLWSAGLS